MLFGGPQDGQFVKSWRIRADSSQDRNIRLCVHHIDQFSQKDAKGRSWLTPPNTLLAHASFTLNDFLRKAVDSFLSAKIPNSVAVSCTRVFAFSVPTCVSHAVHELVVKTAFALFQNESGVPMPKAFVELQLTSVERQPGLPQASQSAILRVMLMENQIQPPMPSPTSHSPSFAAGKASSAPQPSPMTRPPNHQLPAHMQQRPSQNQPQPHPAHSGHQTRSQQQQFQNYQQQSLSRQHGHSPTNDQHRYSSQFHFQPPQPLAPPQHQDARGDGRRQAMEEDMSRLSLQSHSQYQQQPQAVDRFGNPIYGGRNRSPQNRTQAAQPPPRPPSNTHQRAHSPPDGSYGAAPFAPPPAHSPPQHPTAQAREGNPSFTQGPLQGTAAHKKYSPKGGSYAAAAAGFGGFGGGSGLGSFGAMGARGGAPGVAGPSGGYANAVAGQSYAAALAGGSRNGC